MRSSFLTLINAYMFVKGANARKLHLALPTLPIDIDASILNQAKEPETPFKTPQTRQLTNDNEELTNDSDDTRLTLSIDSFQLELNTVSLEELMLIPQYMKEILMSVLPNCDGSLCPGSLSTIVNMTLNEDIKITPVLGRRMLHNRRYLTDPERSHMIVSGGSADFTWGLYYGNPSKDDLNTGILNVLNAQFNNETFLTERNFGNLTGASVSAYAVDSYETEDSSSITETDVQIGGGDSTGISVGAIVSIVAAILAACGIAYRTYLKKGSLAKVGNRYRAARSNLRMKSLKRRSTGEKDNEYLVEVCTDLTVEDPEEGSKSTVNSFSGKSSHDSMPSPTSVKGQKQRVEEMKTINPSDYVVEIGTE